MCLCNHSEARRPDLYWRHRLFFLVDIYSTSCSVSVLGRKAAPGVSLKQIITVCRGRNQVCVLRSSAIENLQ